MNVSGRFQKVAHRGGSNLAPENTLAAFRQALTLSVDAVELDVQMSRDGHAVVFHDATVERLTDGRGNLLDLDLMDLQALDAARHFPGGWHQAEHIPTLREVLNLVHHEQVQIYIEIKPSKRGETHGRYPGIVETVVREVLAAKMQERVMMMSFDWKLLPRIKALAPDMQTGILVSEGVWQPQAEGALATLVSQATTLRCEWIHMDDDLFTPEMPSLFHTNNLRLGIWTVNNLARMRYLVEAGVDALTTDQPDLFRAFQ